jgi:hypothetical protein
MYIVFTLILLLWQTGCRREKQTSLPVHQQRFVEVYVELQKFKQRHSDLDTIPLDSSRVIIQKYGFTKQEFENSLAYFNDNPERWETFYKQVTERLKNRSTPPPIP